MSRKIRLNSHVCRFDSSMLKSQKCLDGCIFLVMAHLDLQNMQ